MKQGQYQRKGLIGKRYGALEVLEVSKTAVLQSGARKYWFRLRCSCGNSDYVVAESNLRQLKDMRCPICRNGKDPAIAAHALSSIWHGMHDRCYRVTADAYQYYGARGIEVCDRWRKVDGDLAATRAAFRAFVEDMGERPPGMSLDRVAVDGPYSPENCRWATATEQNQNRRISEIRKLEKHLGLQSGSIAAMAKKYGKPIEPAMPKLANLTPGSRVAWQTIFEVPRKKVDPTKRRRPNVSPAMRRHLEWAASQNFSGGTQ